MIYEISIEEYSVLQKEHVIKNIKFAVLSEFEASIYEPVTNKCLLIRIKSPGHTLTKLEHKKKFKAISKYEFDDIQEHYNDLVMFDKKTAKAIARKVNSNNWEEIIVHCAAGVSRSAGVMIGIARTLNIPQLEDYVRSCGYYIPNEHVINMFDGE